MFLAEAVAVTGGRVITIDVSADKQRHAHAKLAAVDFCIGDAREIITSLLGPFDFGLINLWKDLYIPCFDLVISKLADAAFLAADNILFPEFTRNDMVAYQRHVRAKRGIESILLPVGSGIELSRFAPRGL